MTKYTLQTFLLLFSFVLTIYYGVGGAEVSLLISGGALLLYLAFGWRKVSLAGKSFVIVNLCFLVGVYFHQQLYEFVALGLSRVQIFSAFLIAVVFLRIAAKSSEMVRTCGEFLINQRPEARYAVLSYGSCVLGGILSFGALNLVGQVIVKGNTLEMSNGDSRIQGIRLKRMSLALLRGFSTLPISSPFAISIALILSIVPSVSWQSLLPVSIGFSVVLIALGWGIDTISYPKIPTGSSYMRKGIKGGRSVVLFLSLIAALFALSAAVSHWGGYSLPMAIILTCPLFGFLWFIVEGIGNTPFLDGCRKFTTDLSDELNTMQTEIAVICCGSFIGVLLSGILSPEMLSKAVGMFGVQGFMLALAACLAVILSSLVGVTPFLSVTLIGSAFGNSEVYGLSPYVFALSLLLGWAFVLNLSPFTVSSILLGKVLGCRPKELSLEWNFVYSLIGLVIALVGLFSIQFLFD